MSSKPSNARHPFNEPAGPEDVILQSSDNVQFHIEKTVLSLSSPFFESMFTLPTPPNGSQDSDREITSKSPVIPLQDPSEALFQLLSWCDPRGEPSMDLESFMDVLKLAEKYDMEHIIKRVDTIIQLYPDIIKDNCFRVYLIAVRFRIPSLVKLSAKLCLSFPIEELKGIEDLNFISGADLQMLYNYRVACINVLQETFFHQNAWCTYLQSSWAELNTLDGKYACGNGCNPTHADAGAYVLKHWLYHYMMQVQKILQKTPTSEALRHPRHSEAFQSTMVLMAQCRTCRSHLGKDLEGFRMSFETRIDEAIQKVDIDCL